jgi:hypothetical protein
MRINRGNEVEDPIGSRSNCHSCCYHCNICWPRYWIWHRVLSERAYCHHANRIYFNKHCVWDSHDYNFQFDNGDSLRDYIVTSTTITSTQTGVVSQASLSNLLVSNLTFSGHPASIGFDVKTDIVYVYVVYSYNLTNLAVINGTTNSLITSIPLELTTQEITS